MKIHVRTRAVPWLAGIWLTLLPALCLAAPVELTAKIDGLFKKWDRKDSPGVIVAIARDGESLHARAYGMANLEHGIALTTDTVTESGSVAKQFTAAAVVLLARRGKLSLEDPIRKHLPEMPAAICDAITLRMLLNHTSGLRDIHGLFDLMGRPSYSAWHDNAEVLRVMSRQRRLNFAPGTEYLYCNAAYILAAMVVQRVSGRSFGEFCIEQVFRPRGMTQTRWRDDFTAIVPGRAAGYEPNRAGGYRLDTPHSNLVGNGGLLTTVGDLLKWNANLDNPTGEWVEVARALQTPSKLRDGRVLDYGLGLGISNENGLLEISHGGSTSGYKTMLARFPEPRLSFALLANAADFNPAPAARSLVRLLLSPPPARHPVAIAVAADVLAKHAGLYHCAQTDTLLTLTGKDGRLLEGTVELIPTAPHTYVVGRGSTTLVYSDGAPPTLTLTTTNGVSTYLPATRATPTAEQLAAYAGTYSSEELGVTREVGVRDGRLAISRWPAPSVTGEATFADGFKFADGWHATFTRDPGGHIDGCELTNGRCRRVRFERR